jgi:hypothetical protein
LFHWKLKNNLAGIDLVERWVALDRRSFCWRVSPVTRDWVSQGLLAICPMLYAWRM